MRRELNKKEGFMKVRMVTMVMMGSLMMGSGWGILEATRVPVKGESLVDIYRGEINGRECEKEVKRVKDLLNCKRYFIKSKGGKEYEIRNMDRGKIQLFLSKKKKRRGNFKVKREEEKEKGLEVWRLMRIKT